MDGVRGERLNREIDLPPLFVQSVYVCLLTVIKIIH